MQDIPKGISTNSFSQCPHWTITQYCLGLPQIFQPEKIYPSNVPFNLITEQKLPFEGKNVVEVHPALALWLWLQDEVKDYKRSSKKSEATSDDKHPKNKKEIIKEIITSLNEKLSFDVPCDIENDDYLDAYIAWKLGDLWQNEQDKVILVGNKNTGAMLLPKEVSEDWQAELDKYK